jgi:hypothetical protein
MQAMKKTQRENILNQASFSKPVWDLVGKLAMQYASNSLKGSKPGKVKDIKQYHLAPLHHLPEAFQVSN